MNNFILILNITLYLAAFIFFYAERKKHSFVSTIFLFYSIVGVFSFLLFNDPLSQNIFSSVSFFPFLFLFTIILIFTYPLRNIDPEKTNKIILPPEFVINSISVFVAFICIISGYNIIINIDQYAINLLLSREEVALLYDMTRKTLDNTSTDYFRLWRIAARNGLHY